MNNSKIRRSDREITDRETILAILNRTKFCNISFNTPEGYPYVLPLSYGYEMEDDKLTLYFHCAKEGRKLTLLERDAKVGFSIAHQGDLIKADKPCNYSTYFESILGYGTLREVVDSPENISAIWQIMRHYDKEVSLAFEENMLKSIKLLALDVESFTAKGKMK